MIMRRKLRMRECGKPDEKEANRRVSQLYDGIAIEIVLVWF